MLTGFLLAVIKEVLQMEQFDALWAYQTEDMKADTIVNEIKRSPIRQKLEKSRDYIMDRQKQYKQIEDEITGMADRKEILAEAVVKADEQLRNLQSAFESNPPQDEDSLKSMLSDVAKCRETLRQYESEMNRIVQETGSHEKLLQRVRVEAAKAKQTFDQLKVDYENESKAKKEELEQQRARVKSLESTVSAELLAEYETIKKHITPPVARLAYGQCSGCNTSLPSAILSKIKNGAIVECETCGRMIIQ